LDAVCYTLFMLNFFRRLVVRQKNCIDGIETSLGLIATNIPKEVECVNVTADFSCVNTLGQDLSPGNHDSLRNNVF